MATVNVQIVVASKAEQGEWSGRVIKGWETYQIIAKGEAITKKRLWTMWLEYPAGIAKGDVVEFIGELGTKAAKLEKDGNTYDVVEHSLNKPSFRVIKAFAPLDPTPASQVVDNTAQPF